MRRKFRQSLETLAIFRRSLIYQTKEFFENSTLHGIRYIAENGRPIGEKLMWFCCTSAGAVTALVIIFSLWEKFQTNPTITGLDTDFHNVQLDFPTTVFCPDVAFDNDTAYNVAYNLAQYDHPTAKQMLPFLKLLTTLSFDNVRKAYDMMKSFPSSVILSLNEKSVRMLAFQVHATCNNTLSECKYRDEIVECCSIFKSIYTENGFCFAFNSRFVSTEDADEKSSTVYSLFETDKKWAVQFLPKVPGKIFIFSNEEYLGSDLLSKLPWDLEQNADIRVTKKSTYTTDDARQLSIHQRKCIFSDEVNLQYFNGDYTYSSCMKECRMKLSIKLCKCNPPFYKPIEEHPMCTVSDFPCLDQNKANITKMKYCRQCELSCSNTVYSIDKLSMSYDKTGEHKIVVAFLTWPFIRYKREVLFGWVDLLVSFGGIAGLFLGFSLLSGVEIIFYFTLRACCMVYKNREELHQIEEENKKKPPPQFDMSLKPKIKKTLYPPHKSAEEQPNQRENDAMIKRPIKIEKRKTIKDYSSYSKSLYKNTKITPNVYNIKNDDQWEYGHYLP